MKGSAGKKKKKQGGDVKLSKRIAGRPSGENAAAWGVSKIVEISQAENMAGGSRKR